MLQRTGKSELLQLVAVLIGLNFMLIGAGFWYLKSAHISRRNGHDESSAQLRRYSTATRAMPGVSSEKTILLWNLPSAVSYPEFLPLDRCGNCAITKDKAKMNNSAAVIFNFRGATKPSDYPRRMQDNPDQVFVWLCRESPRTTKDIYNIDLTQLNNIINWTMTYRLDSDVFFPYVEILHRIYDEKRLSSNATQGLSPYVDLYYTDIDELMTRKRHLVAWVVGNCDNTYGARARMELVNKLIKGGLPIHRYGRCFKGKDFPPYRSEETHERLTEYKFYLAFENTFRCRDYVTYKFWKNAMYSGSVPIVWGTRKEDLLLLAPRNSFIHIEDFESANHLIYFLKYLDTNDTAYRQYFSWREEEIAQQNRENVGSSDQVNVDETDWIFSTKKAFGYCQLCRMLHDEDRQSSKFKRKRISSLQDWWYGSEDKICVG